MPPTIKAIPRIFILRNSDRAQTLGIRPVRGVGDTGKDPVCDRAGRDVVRGQPTERTPTAAAKHTVSIQLHASDMELARG